MKEITKLMINMYKINELGYDFMGYRLRKGEKTFHHLIIPKRKNGIQAVWNGAILMRSTSHDYLHRIENKDEEIFCLITSEMVDMNIKGKLDSYNLKKIRDLLLYFECEHSGDTLKSGKPLIKEIYLKDRVKL